jgi:Lrp/AsnC family leucine-responsive transcriptional regulator
MKQDKINSEICLHLRANSRMSWQKIGKIVHLTGQAVAARVLQMQDDGIISQFTIRQDDLLKHFITVFMKDASFVSFERFLQQDVCVESAYKVAGEGCYQIVYVADPSVSLEAFLDQVLHYGTYKVLSVIRAIK